MVLKCSGELNRMKLKTLLFLKFCLGKLTGPVMAVCVGLPAQWVWGATTHFFIITLFYFLCPDSYKNMFICFFFPLPFCQVADKYHLPQPDSVVCVGCRPEHILAFLVAKVKNISVCS